MTVVYIRLATGENAIPGQPLFVDFNGQGRLASARAFASSNVIGFTTTSGTGGSSVAVQLNSDGVVAVTTPLIVGEQPRLSLASGEIYPSAAAWAAAVSGTISVSNPYYEVSLGPSVSISGLSIEIEAPIFRTSAFPSG